MTRKALNPISAATIIVIMYMIMPILSVLISTYITTYAYMVLVVFLFGFMLLSGGVKRFNIIVFLIFPFIIYIGCSFFLRSDSLTLWGYQNMLFLMPAILGYYYVYHKPESADLLAKILVIAVFITVITTIIGLIHFPYAARILATISDSDDANVIKYSWNNIGGYDFVYSIVLLYPIFILAYKTRKINRLVFLLGFATLLTMIILSEYTTALLLFIISSFLYFAGKRLGGKQLLIIGILAFLAMFIFWDLFSSILLWLADVLNSETLGERITALAGGITGIENSEGNRLELYRTSIRGFLSSPVFGRMTGVYTTSGGHSFILDTLANYGIFGGMAIIFIYRNIYRYFFRPFEYNEGYGYVLWAFVQAIILSLVNTGLWLNILAFFIPVLLCFLYKEKDEDLYENSLDS